MFPELSQSSQNSGLRKEDIKKQQYLLHMTIKKVCYLASLKNIEITENNTEEITELEIEQCPPDTFHYNWEQYSGNNRFDLNLKFLLIYRSYT